MTGKAPALKTTDAIGIVGVGVVGDALRSYYEELGVPLRPYDKYQNIGSIEEVNEADVIFVCVPTPYIEGRGFDATSVAETLGYLSGSKTVLIKSTLVPGTTEALQKRFPQHHVLFQPEFLREKTAREDFRHPDRQIVGYCGFDREIACRLLELLPAAPYEAVMPATSAELVKIATNAFLAMKVTFANQIFDLCGALGVGYDVVKEGLTADPRLGMSHMDVFDSGYRGYGGKCLPKDTLGLIDLAASLGVPLELIETVHEVNQRLSGANEARVYRLAS
jgi:UDPglucose 6-dehydrogenase